MRFFFENKELFPKEIMPVQEYLRSHAFHVNLWLYRRYFCRVRKRDNFRHVSRVKEPDQVSSRTVRDKKNAENEKQQACQF